jgi:hypothetical protein
MYLHVPTCTSTCTPQATDDHNCADAPLILLKGALAVDTLCGQLCGLLLDLPHFSTDILNQLTGALAHYRKVGANSLQLFNHIMSRAEHPSPCD